jgi:catechol 2,3-dioxygenase-like lactoylglutathione lyase family enzyme
MDIMRQVVVFDASDLAAESSFWAGVLGGTVVVEETWHSVFDADDTWRIGVQLAPNHVPPVWPDGAPQQVHLDLHVTDPETSHALVMELGAKLLQEGDPASEEGHRVYADPAGHPFCIGWGHPDDDAVRAFVRSLR